MYIRKLRLENGKAKAVLMRLKILTTSEYILDYFPESLA